jgi:hypothetical protein
MFASTQPNDAAELMRVSAFTRQQASGTGDTDAGATRLSSLNPSLVQDLMRFERDPGESLDVLEVLAASLRHARALLIHVQLERRVIPLTVWPADRHVMGPMRLNQLLTLPLPDLRVLRVEPALERARPAESGETPPDEPPQWVIPIGPLLWELALRGSRDALLPEIAGVAAYRVVPGADLLALDLTGSLASAVARLRKQATPLRDIAQWPGFDRERAMRLLNGLYLQAALMISRTHPSAINPG